MFFIMDEKSQYADYTNFKHKYIFILKTNITKCFISHNILHPLEIFNKSIIFRVTYSF